MYQQLFPPMMTSLFACASVLCCSFCLPSSHLLVEVAPSVSEQGPTAVQPVPDVTQANPGGGGGGLSGGTPEPATILLLTGGALAYCGLRARRRRNHKLIAEEENR